MMDFWTNEEKETILRQLEEGDFLFEKYRLFPSGQETELLGKGGSSEVYNAWGRKTGKKQYAVKVIGFGEEADSKEFWKIVDTQKRLSERNAYIVKIFDAVELWVWLEDNCKVVKVKKWKEYQEYTKEGGNCIHLQILVMEKLIPVLRSNSFGKPEIFPPSLADFQEKQIQKLAHHIGMALKAVHDNNLLHRDIKLENIFYCVKKRKYKLGDFGIAKIMKDGMVSDRAYTHGYGAPEVVEQLEDKYDNTADIYSLGMVLYVLLNELCFPQSKNYYVNTKMQYAQGYVFPPPARGSEEFCNIVSKMCRFSPDERHQSVEEMLNELDSVFYGVEAQYMREQRNTIKLLGILCLVSGAAIWQSLYRPALFADISPVMWIFLLLCIGKGVLYEKKKNTTFVTLGLVGISAWFLYKTGFSWWKFGGLFFLALLGETSTAVFGVSALVMHLMSFVNTKVYVDWKQYFWLMVLLFLFGLNFWTDSMFWEKREKTRLTKVKGKNIESFFMIVSFLLIAAMGWAIKNYGEYMNAYYYQLLAEGERGAWVSYNLECFGIAGVIISLFGVIRDYIGIFLKKRK